MNRLLTSATRVVVHLAVAGLACCTVALAGSVLPAAAQATTSDAPPDTSASVEQLPDGTWAIPLSLTPAGSDHIHFYGREGRTRLRLPVPDGLVPVALEGSMTWSPDVAGGFIGYTAAGDRMRSVAIGAGEADSEMPVAFDLSRATVSNHTIDIEVTHRLESDDPWCSTSLTGSWAEFEGTLILSGEPTMPSSIAEFGTPLLSRLEIQMDPHPTAAEAQSATALSMAFARVSLNPQIDVRVSSDPERSWPSGPSPITTRRIIISRSAAPGISLGQGEVPTLTLGNAIDHEALARSTDLLTSSLAPFALSSEVSASQFDELGEQADATTTTAPLRSGSVTTTLEEAGLARGEQSGLGPMQSQFTVSQSTFGGPVADLSLHLVLRHSTIDDEATARVDIVINEILVQSLPLGTDASETFDLNVPADQMSRNVTVETNVSYSPPGGFCRSDEPAMTWQLDPDRSTITATVGQSLDPGFERFPQVVQEGVNVGIEPLDASTIELTANLLNTVQRGSTHRIRPTVMTVAAAIDRDGPALLVTPTSDDFLRSSPLVATAPLRVMEPQDRAQLLSLDTEVAYAVLQAYENDGRDVLALSWADGGDGGGGMTAADMLVRSLHTADRQFSSLFGDVYLASLDAAPVNVSLTGPSSIPTDRRTAPDYTNRITSIATALGAIVITSAAWLLWNRRRDRRRDRPREGHRDLWRDRRRDRRAADRDVRNEP